MGLLAMGTPLTWDEIEKIQEIIRARAVTQFISKFLIVKDVKADSNKWGDEIECQLIKFDHNKKEVKALLKAETVLHKISEQPKLGTELWHPEYSYFMIEGVPLTPFEGLKDCIRNVEANLRKRRLELIPLLEEPDEVLMTLGNFPFTGCPNFTSPPLEPNPTTSICRSFMYPDGAIFLTHPHFPIVSKNIVDRKNAKPYVNVPIFHDESTPTPFRDPFDGRTPSEFDVKSRRDDCIYLDSMPFGPSCCCLQETFQVETFADVLKLRNQLIPISAIVLALSASTPVYRGYLSDVDSRWDVIKWTLDDRREDEYARIPLSRADSVDMYVDESLRRYNDFPVPYCLEAYNRMLDAKVEPLFAQSLAHLFLRQPIQLFKERLDVDDTKTSELFEDIHLFHWRNVRVKLPPKSKESGWKLEFRPTEIQATDFQNAAFGVFTFLITRLILERKLHVIIPISQAITNMDRAQERDAVTKQRFWFRRSFSADDAEDIGEFTVNDIINGNVDKGMTGLADLIEQWLSDQQSLTEGDRSELLQYVRFVRDRASGKVKTVSKWMRDFIRSHVDYKKDSVVTQRIGYDMLLTIHNTAIGKERDVALTGGYEES